MNQVPKGSILITGFYSKDDNSSPFLTDELIGLLHIGAMLIRLKIKLYKNQLYIKHCTYCKL